MGLTNWMAGRIVSNLDSESAPTTTLTLAIRRAKLWLGCVGFLFLVEIVSGLLLMTVYSPSMTAAWGSVWHIQTRMPAGWLIRGVHHFASDGMIVLLVALLSHFVITRSYRGAGAVAWWAALISLGLVLLVALSGELLPWDQQGYWGTTVRTNILAKIPVVGEKLRALLLGGSEMGNLTLARFHLLHVMVLPGSLAAVLLFHRALAAGVAAKGHPFERPNDRILIAGLRAVLLALVAGTAWYACAHQGSILMNAPADPRSIDYPARPEWHTLFLYEWLKFFHGPTTEVVAAIWVPGAVAAFFFAFPMLGRLLPMRVLRYVDRGLAGALAIGVLGLTLLAVLADRNPSDAAVEAVRAKSRHSESITEREAALLRGREFSDKRAWAVRSGRRAADLAAVKGIPPTGALDLLRNDVMTQGPALFAANCASCHRFDGHDGRGIIPLEEANSSDLKGFAGRAWIRGLLADPMADRYFGRMKTPEGEPAHTKMAGMLAEMREGLESGEAHRAFESELDAVAAYLEFESVQPGLFKSAGEGHPPENKADSTGDESDPGTGSALSGTNDAGVEVVKPDQAAGTSDTDRSRSAYLKDVPPLVLTPLVLKGRGVFETLCNECHSYAGSRSGTTFAPEMLGYGSVEWTASMIAAPNHESRYRSAGREPARMPSFQSRLSQSDRRLLATWLFETR